MGAPTFDKVWAFAPITGAWIETFIIRANADLFPSHPSRVRGLKREKRQSVHGQLNSHPSRVRGLKRLLLSLGFFVMHVRTHHGCVD